MSFFEVFLIALGLAADAFAVSVIAGSTGATRGHRLYAAVILPFWTFPIYHAYSWLARRFWY